MRTALILTVAALALPGARTFALEAHAPASPDASQLLREMSNTLSGARQFSFKARRKIDPVLAAENLLPVDSRITVLVQRPDKIAATSRSAAGTRLFTTDGSDFAMLDVTKKLYSTLPMRTSIDGFVDVLDVKFGFVPPLAEFVVSNPYREIRASARTLSYAGSERLRSGFLGLASTDCHHLTLSGPHADADLWISTKDRLPRRLVATFKNHPGQPRMSIDFSAWNLNAPIPDGAFRFVPPKDAMKIPMRSTAEMDAAMKKGARKTN